MKGEYYHTKETVEEYIRLAKGHNGIKLIEKLKPYLPLNSKLLEIGTGPGTDWKILNKSYQIVGSDNSEEFLIHLKTKYPNSDFLKLDASKLKTDNKFDGIYSNKVLHHLNDNELKTSIKRQSEILNPNGIICHSFWKGTGTEVFKGLFVNYHTNKEIENLFNKDFEILMTENYTEFEDGDSILLVAKKR